MSEDQVAAIEQARAALADSQEEAKSAKIELLRAQLLHDGAAQKCLVQDELIAELRATVAEHRAWQQTDETEDYPEEQFSQCSYRDGHDVQHESHPIINFGQLHHCSNP